MGVHAAIPLIADVANVVIGIALASKGFRNRLVRVFTLLSVTLVAWNLGIFSLYHFKDAASAEWWSRLARSVFFFGPVAGYHLSLVLSPTERRGSTALLVVGYVLAALVSLLNLQGLIVSGVSPHYWGWYPEPTPLYGVATALLLAYMLLSFEGAWYVYRHPCSARERVQAKFWFLAAAMIVPFTLTNFAAVYGAEIYPLGNVATVLYAGNLAYAISRHRLMDVDYVVRKFVSFTASLAVVLVPGGIGLYQLASYMRSDSPLVIVLAAIALALVGVVLVPTLQSALETRVQQALFPRRYDYRQRLRRFGADLVHVLDEHALIRRLGDTLTEVLDVEQCRVLLRDDRSRQFVEVYPQLEGSLLPERLHTTIEAISEPMLLGEIESTSRSDGPVLRQLGVEVVIPLRIEERVTGVIFLSRNRDLQLFSGEDLQILANVAAGASVALENSRLSRELRRSEAFLQRANRLSSLGMLAAGIAHEIRNPLTAVKTFLDLLPLGRSTNVNRSDVDLVGTIEPVVRLMESTARKRQVTLRITAEPRLAAVHADPDQVKQIVLNLLLNAIEASPAGGEVTLRLRGAGRSVLFEVQDQGAGIAADQLDNIFEPFFTTKESGTGLGLALVHQMVVEHGGSITVDSEVGRGTVFRVSLPAAEATLRRTGT